MKYSSYETLPVSHELLSIIYSSFADEIPLFYTHQNEDQIVEQSKVWSLVIEIFMSTEFIQVSFVEFKLTNFGFRNYLYLLTFSANWLLVTLKLLIKSHTLGILYYKFFFEHHSVDLHRAWSSIIFFFRYFTIDTVYVRFILLSYNSSLKCDELFNSRSFI